MTDSTIDGTVRYPVTVIQEGSWELKRKVVGSEWYYQSMIFHICADIDRLISMNGKDDLFCRHCKERIPDSIQAVWVLHNIEIR